jgi:hypothetical protein
MDIYKDWGFNENPFQTTALEADEAGLQLLVGRSKEINKFTRRLFNPPSIVTVEGLNGVGKTSLVNVAIYGAYKRYLNGENTGLFIPCGRTFQLSVEKDPEEFIDEVLLEVAQTLIKKADELKKDGRVAKTNQNSINKWLNSPQLKSFQATAWIIGGGYNSETNTSKGFERSGFRQLIREWLGEIFPKGEKGGIVCTIDNIELLETSEAARKTVEKLRDILFNFSGIRWVICGALGIVKSIVSSPRLEGLLHDPVEISGIVPEDSAAIFTKRVNWFGNKDSYLPITANSFSVLYDVLDKNIRNSLSYSNEYCMYCADEELHPETDEEKDSLFLEWLISNSEQTYTAVKSQLRPRALKLFEDAIDYGGNFSPSDFQRFEFNSIPAMRPHVKDLETAGLLVSTIDGSDNRRRSIHITPKGWMVSYAMKSEKETKED